MSLADLRWRLPWPQPKSRADLEGPTGPLRFELDGTRFSVTPTGSELPALVNRYVVWCLTCSKLLHGSCLAPAAIVEGHVLAHEKGTTNV
jgi:hypothetical protein